MGKRRTRVLIAALIGLTVYNLWASVASNNALTVSQSPTRCNFAMLNQLHPPLEDFVHFPCLQNATQSDQLNRQGRCVRTLLLPVGMLDDKTDCVPLKFGRGTPICTYPQEEDIHVSHALQARGLWEEGLVRQMILVLARNPEMVLFDVGCNIGVYTLTAALHSHRVVALDANFENLFLVSKSLSHGSLEENVTLIWNAVSKEHETVVLRKQTLNVGGSEIDADVDVVSGCDISVNAIVLDDLKDLFVNKKVFIKIDIQGQEHNFFEYGKEFFKMADVRYVQIEYEMHRGIPSGKVIIDNMEAYGFLPYTVCLNGKLLNPGKEADWPYDICFIRS